MRSKTKRGTPASPDRIGPPERKHGTTGRRIAVAAVGLVGLLATAGSNAAEEAWVHYDNNADIRAIHLENDTLWVGTNGGIVIVDAHTGEVAGKIRLGPFLPDNSVRTITGRGDSILIGTDRGFTVIAPGSTEVFTRAQGAFFDDIRWVSDGPRGELYVASFGHGIGVFAGDSIRHITRADSLLDDKTYAVAAIDSYTVYYATSLGLCAYRDSAWVGFQAGAGIPRGEVRALVHRGNGRFYLLITGRGIYRFNGRRARRIGGTQDVFPAGEVSAICFGDDETLWAAGRYGGIGRYRSGVWTAVAEGDAQVRHARWRCAYAAPDGTIYFGSADGLVAVVTEDAVRKIMLPSTLPSGHTGPMAEDSDGRRYVVNGSSVLSIDGGSFALEVDPGLVFALAASPRGDVWASTPWGLLRRDGRRWVEVGVDIEPSAPVFVSLAFDPGGALWAGGHNGDVYRYDGQFWVRYASGLCPGPIQRILVGVRSGVWAWSRESGFFRYEGRGWVPVPLPGEHPPRIVDVALAGDGMPIAVTRYDVWQFDETAGWVPLAPGVPRLETGAYRSIYVDRDGGLYVGAVRGLMVAFSDGVRWIPGRGGLSGMDVSHMLVDRDGRLWVGFERDGLSTILVENLPQPRYND